MPTYTEEYKTAAVAPDQDEIVLEALEFYHSSWTGPERVVNVRNGETLTLEATAPFDPSTPQTFQGLLFKFQRPRQTDGGAQPMTISMPNISRATAQLFKNAIKAGGSIECIWRTYLQSDLTSPQIDPPPRFNIYNVTTTPFELKAESRFYDWLGKSSHKVFYSDETVPSLVR